MLRAKTQFRPEQPLSIRLLLEGLLTDGRISAADMRRLQGVVPGALHPLVFLAEQKMTDLAEPDRVLGMSELLGWLSERTEQAVVEIDPLKINVAAVAEVMSRDRKGGV